VAWQLARQGFADWTEAHRLAVNIDTAYREIDAARTQPVPVEMFARMASIEARQRLVG
jgi:hypothetical protein